MFLRFFNSHIKFNQILFGFIIIFSLVPVCLFFLFPFPLLLLLPPSLDQKLFLIFLFCLFCLAILVLHLSVLLQCYRKDWLVFLVGHSLGFFRFSRLFWSTISPIIFLVPLPPSRLKMLLWLLVCVHICSVCFSFSISNCVHIHRICTLVQFSLVLCSFFI